jgi:hypothetical protein
MIANRWGIPDDDRYSSPGQPETDKQTAQIRTIISIVPRKPLYLAHFSLYFGVITLQI